MPAPNTVTISEPGALAADVLDGAAEIGAFLGVSRRRAFYLCEKKMVPAYQLGRRWYARRSRLIEHIERLENEAL